MADDGLRENWIFDVGFNIGGLDSLAGMQDSVQKLAKIDELASTVKTAISDLSKDTDRIGRILAKAKSHTASAKEINKNLKAQQRAITKEVISTTEKSLDDVYNAVNSKVDSLVSGIENRIKSLKVNIPSDKMLLRAGVRIRAGAKELSQAANDITNSLKLLQSVKDINVKITGGGYQGGRNVATGGASSVSGNINADMSAFQNAVDKAMKSIETAGATVSQSTKNFANAFNSQMSASGRQASAQSSRSKTYPSDGKEGPSGKTSLKFSKEGFDAAVNINLGKVSKAIGQKFQQELTRELLQLQEEVSLAKGSQKKISISESSKLGADVGGKISTSASEFSIKIRKASQEAQKAWTAFHEITHGRRSTRQDPLSVSADRKVTKLGTAKKVAQDEVVTDLVAFSKTIKVFGKDNEAVLDRVSKKFGQFGTTASSFVKAATSGVDPKDSAAVLGRIEKIFSDTKAKSIGGVGRRELDLIIDNFKNNLISRANQEAKSAGLKQTTGGAGVKEIIESLKREVQAASSYNKDFNVTGVGNVRYSREYSAVDEAAISRSMNRRRKELEQASIDPQYKPLQERQGRSLRERIDVSNKGLFGADQIIKALIEDVSGKTISQLGINTKDKENPISKQFVERANRRGGDFIAEKTSVAREIFEYIEGNVPAAIRGQEDPSYRKLFNALYSLLGNVKQASIEKTAVPFRDIEGRAAGRSVETTLRNPLEQGSLEGVNITRGGGKLVSNEKVKAAAKEFLQTIRKIYDDTSLTLTDAAQEVSRTLYTEGESSKLYKPVKEAYDKYTKIAEGSSDADVVKYFGTLREKLGAANIQILANSLQEIVQEIDTNLGRGGSGAKRPTRYGAGSISEQLFKKTKDVIDVEGYDVTDSDRYIKAVSERSSVLDPILPGHSTSFRRQSTEAMAADPSMLKKFILGTQDPSVFGFKEPPSIGAMASVFRDPQYVGKSISEIMSSAGVDPEMATRMQSATGIQSSFGKIMGLEDSGKTASFIRSNFDMFAKMNPNLSNEDFSSVLQTKYRETTGADMDAKFADSISQVQAVRDFLRHVGNLMADMQHLRGGAVSKSVQKNLEQAIKGTEDVVRLSRENTPTEFPSKIKGVGKDKLRRLVENRYAFAEAGLTPETLQVDEGGELSQLSLKEFRKRYKEVDEQLKRKGSYFKNKSASSAAEAEAQLELSRRNKALGGERDQATAAERIGFKTLFSEEKLQRYRSELEESMNRYNSLFDEGGPAAKGLRELEQRIERLKSYVRRLEGLSKRDYTIGGEEEERAFLGSVSALGKSAGKAQPVKAAQYELEKRVAQYAEAQGISPQSGVAGQVMSLLLGGGLGEGTRSDFINEELFKKKAGFESRVGAKNVPYDLGPDETRFLLSKFDTGDKIKSLQDRLGKEQSKLGGPGVAGIYTAIEKNLTDTLQNMPSTFSNKIREKITTGIGNLMQIMAGGGNLDYDLFKTGIGGLQTESKTEEAQLNKFVSALDETNLEKQLENRKRILGNVSNIKSELEPLKQMQQIVNTISKMASTPAASAFFEPLAKLPNITAKTTGKEAGDAILGQERVVREALKTVDQTKDPALYKEFEFVFNNLREMGSYLKKNASRNDDAIGKTIADRLKVFSDAIAPIVDPRKALANIGKASGINTELSIFKDFVKEFSAIRAGAGTDNRTPSINMQMIIEWLREISQEASKALGPSSKGIEKDIESRIGQSALLLGRIAGNKEEIIRSSTSPAGQEQLLPGEKNYITAGQRQIDEARRAQEAVQEAADEKVHQAQAREAAARKAALDEQRALSIEKANSIKASAFGKADVSGFGSFTVSQLFNKQIGEFVKPFATIGTGQTKQITGGPYVPSIEQEEEFAIRKAILGLSGLKEKSPGQVSGTGEYSAYGGKIDIRGGKPGVGQERTLRLLDRAIQRLLEMSDKEIASIKGLENASVGMVKGYAEMLRDITRIPQGKIAEPLVGKVVSEPESKKQIVTQSQTLKVISDTANLTKTTTQKIADLTQSIAAMNPAAGGDGGEGGGEPPVGAGGDGFGGYGPNLLTALSAIAVINSAISDILGSKIAPDVSAIRNLLSKGLPKNAAQAGKEVAEKVGQKMKEAKGQADAIAPMRPIKGQLTPLEELRLKIQKDIGHLDKKEINQIAKGEGIGDRRRSSEALINDIAIKKLEEQRALENASLIAQAKDRSKKDDQISSNAKAIDAFKDSGKVTKNLKNLDAQAAKTETKMSDILKGVANRVVLYGGMSFLMYGLSNRIQQVVQEMIAFEAAMTRVTKVMNPLLLDTKALSDAARNMGREFGASIIESADAMTVFAQQGKSASEVVQLARASMLAANTTTLKGAEATEALTAALRQFNIEDSRAVEILDSWNEVENRTAITSSNLANAIKQAGTAANVAGLTFDELNGFVSAVGSATRQTGNELGRSFRYILSHIRTDEAIAAIQGLGIAVSNADGDFRDSFEILQDLAMRWESLSSVQRQNAAIAIAGTRRYNTLLVLLNKWDDVLKATNYSLDSQGSTIRENQKVMETAEKQLAKLRASMSGLFTSIGDAGGLAIFKTFTGLLENTVNLANGLPDSLKAAVATIGTIVGGAATAIRAAQFSGLAGFVSDTGRKFSEESANRKAVKSVSRDAGGVGFFASSKNVEQSINKLQGSYGNIVNNQKELLITSKGINRESGIYQERLTEIQRLTEQNISATVAWRQELISAGDGVASIGHRMTAFFNRYRGQLLTAGIGLQILAQTQEDALSPTGKTFLGESLDATGTMVTNMAIFGGLAKSGGAKLGDGLGKSLALSGKNLKAAKGWGSALAIVATTLALSSGELKDMYTVLAGSEEQADKIRQIENERLKTTLDALDVYERINKTIKESGSISAVDLQNLDEAKEKLARILPGALSFGEGGRLQINDAAIEEALGNRGSFTSARNRAVEEQAVADFYRKSSTGIFSGFQDTNFENVTQEIDKIDKKLRELSVSSLAAKDALNQAENSEERLAAEKKLAEVNREISEQMDLRKKSFEEVKGITEGIFEIISKGPGREAYKVQRGLGLEDLTSEGYSDRIKTIVDGLKDLYGETQFVKEAARQTFSEVYNGMQTNAPRDAQKALEEYGKQFLLLEERAKRGVDGLRSFQILVQDVNTGERETIGVNVEEGANEAEIMKKVYKNLNDYLKANNLSDALGEKDIVYTLTKISSAILDIPLGSFKKLFQSQRVILDEIKANFSLYKNELELPIRLGRLSFKDSTRDLETARNNARLAIEEIATAPQLLGAVPEGFDKVIDKIRNTQLQTSELNETLLAMKEISLQGSGTIADLFAATVYKAQTASTAIKLINKLPEKFFRATDREDFTAAQRENVIGEELAASQKYAKQINELLKSAGLEGITVEQAKTREEVVRQFQIVVAKQISKSYKDQNEVIKKGEELLTNQFKAAQKLRKEQANVSKLRAFEELAKNGKLTTEVLSSIDKEAGPGIDRAKKKVLELADGYSLFAKSLQTQLDSGNLTEKETENITKMRDAFIALEKQARKTSEGINIGSVFGQGFAIFDIEQQLSVVQNAGFKFKGAFAGIAEESQRIKEELTRIDLLMKEAEKNGRSTGKLEEQKRKLLRDQSELVKKINKDTAGIIKTQKLLNAEIQTSILLRGNVLEAQKSAIKPLLDDINSITNTLSQGITQFGGQVDANIIASFRKAAQDLGRQQINLNVVGDAATQKNLILASAQEKAAYDLVRGLSDAGLSAKEIFADVGLKELAQTSPLIGGLLDELTKKEFNREFQQASENLAISFEKNFAKQALRLAEALEKAGFKEGAEAVRNTIETRGKASGPQFKYGSMKYFPGNDGKIPGSPNQAFPAVLHGGERVLSVKEIDNLQRMGVPGFASGSAKRKIPAIIPDTSTVGNAPTIGLVRKIKQVDVKLPKDVYKALDHIEKISGDDRYTFRIREHLEKGYRTNAEGGKSFVIKDAQKDSFIRRDIEFAYDQALEKKMGGLQKYQNALKKASKLGVDVPKGSNLEAVNKLIEQRQKAINEVNLKQVLRKQAEGFGLNPRKNASLESLKKMVYERAAKEAGGITAAQMKTDIDYRLSKGESSKSVFGTTGRLGGDIIPATTVGAKRANLDYAGVRGQYSGVGNQYSNTIRYSGVGEYTGVDMTIKPKDVYKNYNNPAYAPSKARQALNEFSARTGSAGVSPSGILIDPKLSTGASPTGRSARTSIQKIANSIPKGTVPTRPVKSAIELTGLQQYNALRKQALDLGINIPKGTKTEGLISLINEQLDVKAGKRTSSGIIDPKLSGKTTPVPSTPVRRPGSTGVYPTLKPAEQGAQAARKRQISLVSEVDGGGSGTTSGSKGVETGGKKPGKVKSGLGIAAKTAGVGLSLYSGGKSAARLLDLQTLINQEMEYGSQLGDEKSVQEAIAGYRNQQKQEVLNIASNTGLLATILGGKKPRVAGAGALVTLGSDLAAAYYARKNDPPMSWADIGKTYGVSTAFTLAYNAKSLGLGRLAGPLASAVPKSGIIFPKLAGAGAWARTSGTAFANAELIALGTRLAGQVTSNLGAPVFGDPLIGAGIALSPTNVAKGLYKAVTDYHGTLDNYDQLVKDVGAETYAQQVGAGLVSFTGGSDWLRGVAKGDVNKYQEQLADQVMRANRVKLTGDISTNEKIIQSILGGLVMAAGEYDGSQDPSKAENYLKEHHASIRDLAVYASSPGVVDADGNKPNFERLVEQIKGKDYYLSNAVNFVGGDAGSRWNAWYPFHHGWQDAARSAKSDMISELARRRKEKEEAAASKAFKEERANRLAEEKRRKEESERSFQEIKDNFKKKREAEWREYQDLLYDKRLANKEAYKELRKKKQELIDKVVSPKDYFWKEQEKERYQELAQEEFYKNNPLIARHHARIDAEYGDLPESVKAPMQKTVLTKNRNAVDREEQIRMLQALSGDLDYDNSKVYGNTVIPGELTHGQKRIRKQIEEAKAQKEVDLKNFGRQELYDVSENEGAIFVNPDGSIGRINKLRSKSKHSPELEEINAKMKLHKRNYAAVQKLLDQWIAANWREEGSAAAKDVERSLNIDKLRSYKTGSRGRLPGSREQASLAVLHGQERVLSATEVDKYEKMGVPGFKNGSAYGDASSSVFMRAGAGEAGPVIEKFKEAVTEFKESTQRVTEGGSVGRMLHEGEVVINIGDDVRDIMEELRGLIMEASNKRDELRVGDLVQGRGVQ